MKPIWIAAVNTGHNSSVCLLRDGELVFHIEEERLSRIKYDDLPLLAISKIKEYTNALDYFILIDEKHKTSEDNFFIRLVCKLGLVESFSSPKIIVGDSTQHHLYHAAGAFYNSGFNDAVVLVADAGGGIHKDKDGNHIGIETESVYTIEYPSTINCVISHIGTYQTPLRVGAMYSGLSIELGHGPLDCGKAMGLSTYGKPDEAIPPVSEIFEHNLNAYTHPTIKDFASYNKQNLCYAVQKFTEQQMVNSITHALNITGKKNLVLTGGVALNCVANYEYLRCLPADVKIYVDPPAYDGGLSIGAAKLYYNVLFPSNPVKQNSFCLGPIPTYDYTLPLTLTEQDASYDDIVDLLTQGNIVAMYQGRAESGPRALGNRSILFDPRIKNGKDVVNSVKRREWYRPFAGAVMKEYVNDWFDMRGLEESPSMMFAVNVLPRKQKKIPAITHVDGTCRVQTVTKEQNEHFYNLIEAFNKKTNVPILFNTSFNLAGDPLVEKIEEAFETILKSEIDFLYLPELNKLVRKL